MPSRYDYDIPFADQHRQGYEHVEQLSEAAKREELVRIGILDENHKLTERYGGEPNVMKAAEDKK